MIGCLYEFAKILQLISPRKYLLLLPLAIFYIILPVLMLIDLGINGAAFVKQFEWQSVNKNYSALFPCAIIFSIWINDTMAYIVGSLIGKTPFSKISPKKTWEGTVGGGLLCILVIGLLGYFIPAAQIFSPYYWICIAAICAIMGTLGDLLESKLKRMASIKDSGSFMPGHGGFLDRFDSLLIATPFVWIYVKLIW